MDTICPEQIAAATCLTAKDFPASGGPNPAIDWSRHNICSAAARREPSVVTCSGAQRWPFDPRPIFVTPAFRDSHAERDYLRMRVFPELEERLRQRRCRLEPCSIGFSFAVHSRPSACAIQSNSTAGVASGKRGVGDRSDDDAAGRGVVAPAVVGQAHSRLAHGAFDSRGATAEPTSPSRFEGPRGPARTHGREAGRGR